MQWEYYGRRSHRRWRGDERQVPGPDPCWAYEPKFDGWRTAAFTALEWVPSRRDNDLAARFPEIARAAQGLGDLVVDGELVALREGRLDFGALTSSPKGRAAAGVAIYYIVFDLLADGETDVRGEPYRARRTMLEERFADVQPPLHRSHVGEATKCDPEVSDP